MARRNELADLNIAQLLDLLASSERVFGQEAKRTERIRAELNRKMTLHGPIVVSLADMLAGLRSPDFTLRIKAGFLLAKSIGAGLALQGVPPEDVESGAIGKDLSALLGRAMAGDLEAVDALERAISDHPPAGLPKRNAVPRTAREEAPSE